MILSEVEGLKTYMTKIAHEVLEKEIEMFTMNIRTIAKLATLTMVVTWQFFIMAFERDGSRCDDNCGGDWEPDAAAHTLLVLMLFYGCVALSFGAFVFCLSCFTCID